MTLVLAVGNSDQVVQVSDRLLVDARGPNVLPKNKAVVLHLADARLVCGFAGLARAGTFSTDDWMLNAFMAAASPDYEAAKMIPRFLASATETFRRDPRLQRLSREERCVSFMFTGYLDRVDPPLLVGAIMSNFQDFQTGRDNAEAWDSFRSLWITEKRPAPESVPTYVQRIGIWPAMDWRDIDGIRRLLAECRPHQAIVEKSVSIVRDISSRPASAGRVGSDLSSITVFRDASRLPITGYHPVAGAHEWHGVSTVFAAGDEAVFSMKNMVIRADDPGSDTPFMVKPKVGRNKPCPCGSEKKYKLCCGS